LGLISLLLLLASVTGLAQSVPDAPASAQTNSPTFRLERETLSSHAELVTLFGRLQDPASSEQILDVPLVSVLRDTLGDSESSTDRLRQVWILTSARPTLVQRLASALSFVRVRTGSQPHASRVPSASIDLAAPGKTVWPSLLGHGLQSTQFDPLGMEVRTATRSYRGDFSDYRKLQVFQALTAMEGFEREGAAPAWFPQSDLEKIYSRLSLTNRTFGGLVRDEKLSKFYDKEASRDEETRGHNWELLRQRAEAEGLYFEPLGLPDSAPSAALLWVARDDLKQRAHQRFDRQFLNIANPWTDERLANWTGYTESRYLDAENRPSREDTPGARQVEMIPLAFYSLDYPRVPLLLADFRDTFKPKRGELARHGATTVLTGIFGITRFGNLTFFAADATWNFVRGRHGAANNRTARLEAYAEARAFLALDTTLDAGLKSDLMHRLDHLAINPLQNGLSTEATVAKEQYTALLEYAQSQEFAAKLERNRRKELDAYTRSRGARLLAAIGHFFLPPSDTPNKSEKDMLTELAARRTLLYHQRYLEQILAASPRPDVVANANDLRAAIEALASDPHDGSRSSRLIAAVFARSSNPEIRYACLRALQRSNGLEARQELLRLSQDPQTGDGWRLICTLYLRGENPAPPAASPGGAQ